MYAAMLRDRDRAQADTSSLTVCISGGAATLVEIMRGFEQAFGCVSLEGYGPSETSAVASRSMPGEQRFRARVAEGAGDLTAFQQWVHRHDDEPTASAP